MARRSHLPDTTGRGAISGSAKLKKDKLHLQMTQVCLPLLRMCNSLPWK
jgi:hypothetical protein